MGQKGKAMTIPVRRKFVTPEGPKTADTRYANDPPTRHPRIRGNCPSCGSGSLILGSDGYVTCTVIGCKDPGVLTDALMSGIKAGPNPCPRCGGGNRVPGQPSVGHDEACPAVASRDDLLALAERLESLDVGCKCQLKLRLRSYPLASHMGSCGVLSLDAVVVNDVATALRALAAAQETSR